MEFLDCFWQPDCGRFTAVVVLEVDTPTHRGPGATVECVSHFFYCVTSRSILVLRDGLEGPGAEFCANCGSVEACRD